MTNLVKLFLLRAGLASLSGVALALCFPPFDQAWLIWGWLWLLFPILWTCKTRLRGFGIGYLVGFVFWAINIKWILTVTWVGVIAVSAYLALYFACFGAFAAVAGNPWRKEMPLAKTIPQRFLETGRSLGYAALLGGLWCGLEWIRGWMLTGFGWNGLGVAFHQSFVLAQNAEFVGVTGLSFLPVFFSAIVVQVARRFYKQNVVGGIKLLHWDFATGLIVIMGAFTLGSTRLNLARDTDVIKAEVLLIQQDIPQFAHSVTWEANEIVDGFIELTETKLNEIDDQAAAKLLETPEEPVVIRRPDLLVWPEVALHDRFYLEEGSPPTAGAPLESALEYLRSLGDFTHLLGVMEVDFENDQAWNSLMSVTRENQRATYRKKHLVLFGEYIPDIAILRKLYEHSAGVEYHANLAAGQGTDGLELKINGEEVEVIPSICFEDTVPRLPREFVKDHPQVIVNVTNDGWFQESEAAAQHFANARFRCIELRRPMIRCANRGSTAIVSVTGSTFDPFTNEHRELVDQQGSHFTRGTLLASVHIPRNPVRTLYSIRGDWFAVAGLIMALVWGFFYRWRRTSS